MCHRRCVFGRIFIVFFFDFLSQIYARSPTSTRHEPPNLVPRRPLLLLPKASVLSVVRTQHVVITRHFSSNLQLFGHLSCHQHGVFSTMRSSSHAPLMPNFLLVFFSLVRSQVATLMLGYY